MWRLPHTKHGAFAVHNFEERLAAIEKSNRRWKWSAAALGLGLLVITTVAADKPSDAVPDVVYARKFVAINERGEPVAFMGHAKNVGMVSVADPEGALLFVASATDSGHGVASTFDNRGRKLVTMGANHAGDGHVAIYDQEGKELSPRVGAQPASTGGRRVTP